MNIAYHQPRGYVMDRVKVDLKHCYGIRALKHEFDFAKGGSAFAIYAPNGAMKSSFAQTFIDLANEQDSTDRIFPTRETKRAIVDKNNQSITPASVLVVKPYDEDLGHTEKTSTLLVDTRLRQEYERLDRDIEKAKNALVNAVKQQSGGKQDFEAEISSAFTTTDDDFYTAVTRIRSELETQKETPLADVIYDKIFNDKVISALNTKNLKSLVEDYVKRYNVLLDNSTFFKRGTFDYYNAGEIAKSLSNNGFFNAKHTVRLNANGKSVEIKTEQELENIIDGEKQEILNDKTLRKNFDAVAKALARNNDLRDFAKYMQDNESLLSRLSNLEKFKEDVLKSYLRVNYDAYTDLMDKFDSAKQRKKEIEEEARSQRTLWEEVIGEFNNRFFVPFKLEAKNREAVILGAKAMIDLGFTYKDGDDSVAIGKSDLLNALSTGERRAFYILNVLFEIAARRKDSQETLLIVDDIADSFDYQNKYAIIQYLRDISEYGLFKQIILPHNFDFFRTIESRYVNRANCLMATRSLSGIKLEAAVGIRNIFINDWKINFENDPKKKIASIPFLRNLVEYCEGDDDIKFEKLTSLLHWKAGTTSITIAELDAIYNQVCNQSSTSANATEPVYDVIKREASLCAQTSAGTNFENKIVMSIAIRLAAEKYMADNLSDKSFLATIKSSQTYRLASKFKKENPNGPYNETLDRVLLMTPENIHLNSFMYEPIVDMSDEHLRKLYQEVLQLP